MGINLSNSKNEVRSARSMLTSSPGWFQLTMIALEAVGMVVVISFLIGTCISGVDSSISKESVSLEKKKNYYFASVAKTSTGVSRT